MKNEVVSIQEQGIVDTTGGERRYHTPGVKIPPNLNPVIRKYGLKLITLQEITPKGHMRRYQLRVSPRVTKELSEVIIRDLMGGKLPGPDNNFLVFIHYEDIGDSGYTLQAALEHYKAVLDHQDVKRLV